MVLCLACSSIYGVALAFSPVAPSSVSLLDSPLLWCVPGLFSPLWCVPGLLVDVDMSGKLFESIMVETDGLAFHVNVVYEKQPGFCANCKMIGLTIQSCKKISSTKNHEETVKVTKKVPIVRNQKSSIDTGSTVKKLNSQSQVQITLEEGVNEALPRSPTHYEKQMV